MSMSGLGELISLVDEAVAKDSVEETVEAIKGELCRLIRSGRIDLPPDLTRPIEGRYARRLLHRDDERGYSIVVMAWGPASARRYTTIQACGASKVSGAAASTCSNTS
jgi:hypothetical protein